MCPAPKRILLVEDEVLIRVMVAEQIRDAGLAVIEAGNADEAWAVLQSGAAVDLVFSDIRMPGSMDGLALAARVQALDPALPIILASGNAAPDVTKRHPVLVTKPYKVDEVVALMLDTLGRKRPEAP